MLHLNSITEVAKIRKTLNWGDPKNAFFKSLTPPTLTEMKKMADPHMQQGKKLDHLPSEKWKMYHCYLSKHLK